MFEYFHIFLDTIVSLSLSLSQKAKLKLFDNYNARCTFDQDYSDQERLKVSLALVFLGIGRADVGD